MAGTGHAWEVANSSEARAFAAEIAAGAPEGPGSAWFLSKKFIRHLTDERYCVRVAPERAAVLADGFDSGERELLVRKAEAGADIRMFSRAVAGTSSASFSHIADWMQWIERNDQAQYGKIARVAVADALLKAERWLLRLNSGPVATGGKAAKVLDGGDGMAWHVLEDALALASEGHAMKHCVGS